MAKYLVSFEIESECDRLKIGDFITEALIDNLEEGESIQEVKVTPTE